MPPSDRARSMGSAPAARKGEYPGVAKEAREDEDYSSKPKTKPGKSVTWFAPLLTSLRSPPRPSGVSPELRRRRLAGEAACEAEVAVRMKRAGARWRHTGGQAVLTFRALSKSGRFDRAWALLAASYHTEVYTPDNVVSLESPARGDAVSG